MTPLKPIHINQRAISSGQPVYIIAELSANHRQDYAEAVKLVKAAKAAGADAVKLQTYTADTLTIDCDAECFRHQSGSLWEGQTLYKLYQQAATPWDWQPQLKQLAEGIDIDLFSSPFDASAVDFLEQMQVPAYKIASFEIVDIPLIEKVAATGKPLILSTGMASIAEIDDALSAARGAGATEIALLKCCSAYPAPSSAMYLRSIPDMIERFRVPVGLSDHSLGLEIPLAAVALGACIIEKHFTLDRSVPSADAAFSLNPKEFTAMVKAVRRTEMALGEIHYGPGEQEQESLGFRRSLFVVADIAAGEMLTEHNIRSIRPAGGLPPKEYEKVLGLKTRTALSKGTPLKWEDLT